MGSGGREGEDFTSHYGQTLWTDTRLHQVKPKAERFTRISQPTHNFRIINTQYSHCPTFHLPSSTHRLYFSSCLVLRPSRFPLPAKRSSRYYHRQALRACRVFRAHSGGRKEEARGFPGGVPRVRPESALSRRVGCAFALIFQLGFSFLGWLCARGSPALTSWRPLSLAMREPIVLEGYSVLFSFVGAWCFWSAREGWRMKINL